MSRTHDRTAGPLFDLAPKFTVMDSMFDAGQPGVYAAFVKAAEEAKSAGVMRYSAYTLRERLRWHFQIERGDREFKIDNSWTPYMARRLMRERPEFKDFFETREPRSA